VTWSMTRVGLDSSMRVVVYEQDAPMVSQWVSEPGAVAMGSRCSDRCFLIRSHPAPHARCSRGDPAPLPVLTLSFDS